MDEKTYLETDAVRVTSARVVIGEQTFATRNIASVKVQGGGRPWLGAFLLLIGIGAAQSSPIFGITLIVMGLVAGWHKMMNRRLVLSSAGGEAVAMASTNAKAIETLRAAVAEAIAAR